jgi:hypothetical protein
MKVQVSSADKEYRIALCTEASEGKIERARVEGTILGYWRNKVSRLRNSTIFTNFFKRAA